LIDAARQSRFFMVSRSWRCHTHRTPAGDTSHGVKLLRTLTDRGTEYCGNPERHEYELYLAVVRKNPETRRKKIRMSLFPLSMASSTGGDRTEAITKPPEMLEVGLKSKRHVR
jgi:hypothetical protein